MFILCTDIIGAQDVYFFAITDKRVFSDQSIDIATQDRL